MNWLRVRELVRKEFIQLFRDRKNRPMLVIAPLIQVILFGYVVTTDVRDITIAVIDQSRTPDSRRLLDAFDGNPTFRVTHVLQDPKDLDRLLLQREVDIGLQIPPDFSARIRKGETAEVQVLVDGSMSNMAAVRIAYSVNVLDAFNTQLLRELNRRRIDFGEIDGRIRTWYNPNLDSQNYYVPGIVAFLVMLLSLIFTSMAVVREKEAGTMEQLIVTPLKADRVHSRQDHPLHSHRPGPDGDGDPLRPAVVRDPHDGQRIRAARRKLHLSAEHPRHRAADLHRLPHPAAGHDDQLLFHPAVFHAERVRLPHRQHARRGAVADAPEPPEPFSDHHPGGVPEGHGLGDPVAAVPGAGRSRRARFYRCGQAVPETVGLEFG